MIFQLVSNIGVIQTKNLVTTHGVNRFKIIIA